MEVLLDYLLNSKQITMRQNGILTKDEVAGMIGDLLVAENVLTGERRVIEPALAEGTRRVLKG